jgi:imidazolonepropionase-like amidohydrolase
VWTAAEPPSPFFDCHVHVTLARPSLLDVVHTPFSLQFFIAAANLRTTLDTGITYVRDAGGADLGIQEAVSRGLIPGPRMQIAVNMLTQTGGHGDPWTASGTEVPLFAPHPGRPAAVVDGPDEVRRKVRQLLRAGADVIKIYTTGGVLSERDDPSHPHVRDDEIAMTVTEAAAAGAHVMAHAIGADGIKAAVRNGARSIEHGIFLDDEAIEMMLTAGTWLVPTMHAPRALLRAAAAGLSFTQSSIDKATFVAGTHEASVKRAHDAGVRIAMGTDCGVGVHGTNLEELSLLAAAGHTATEALHAATGSAAELLGVDHEVGTLQPGRRADLVIIDGSPGDLADPLPRPGRLPVRRARQ